MKLYKLRRVGAFREIPSLLRPPPLPHPRCVSVREVRGQSSPTGSEGNGSEASAYEKVALKDAGDDR